MKKINITKEQVWGFVKNCCIAAYGAMVVAGAYFCRSTTTSSLQETCKPVIATYSGAVDVIVNSSMLDSNKTCAIELLKHDKDVSYYSAVISTVNSSMLDSRKIATIKTLSEK